MVPRPQLIVLDVNETLSDLSPMARRFQDLGVPGELAEVWFASTLRDGFALTVAGQNPAFAELAQDAARSVLAGRSLTQDLEPAVLHVMGGFDELGVHDDVAPGLRALAELGICMVTLSNGAAAIAERLMCNAGVDEFFDQFLSVSRAAAWKPSAAAYDFALAACDMDREAAMLVSVHPWDVDGAARAGLRTAWVDRVGSPYPSVFTAPELTARSLVDLAEQLT